MRMIVLLASAIFAGAPGSAVAASFVDPADIDLEVARFTGAGTGAPGGARLPVDRRLRLARCTAPLAIEWYGRGRGTVLVRCPDSGGWRLFVQIESGTVAAEANAVSRGEAVTIAIRGAGFTLTRQGEALEAGAAGDWIRVRPVGAKADPIRARVLQPGKVGMDLP